MFPVFSIHVFHTCFPYMFSITCLLRNHPGTTAPSIPSIFETPSYKAGNAGADGFSGIPGYGVPLWQWYRRTYATCPHKSPRLSAPSASGSTPGRCFPVPVQEGDLQETRSVRRDGLLPFYGSPRFPSGSRSAK